MAARIDAVQVGISPHTLYLIIINGHASEYQPATTMRHRLLTPLLSDLRCASIGPWPT